jgi:hypothetical protein
MNAFDVIVQQIDEKVTQLKDFLAEGRSENFEDYKKTCGEIKVCSLRGGTF